MITSELKSVTPFELCLDKGHKRCVWIRICVGGLNKVCT